MSFAPKARYKQGEPIMIDYTPNSAVNAGDVIVLSGGVRIAHSDIAAGAQGALAAGHGIYTVPKASTSASGIPDDTVVYWDATNFTITTVSSGHAKFGLTIGASADGDTAQDVLHVPA